MRHKFSWSIMPTEILGLMCACVKHYEEETCNVKEVTIAKCSRDQCLWWKSPLNSTGADCYSVCCFYLRLCVERTSSNKIPQSRNFHLLSKSQRLSRGAILVDLVALDIWHFHLVVVLKEEATQHVFCFEIHLETKTFEEQTPAWLNWGRVLCRVDISSRCSCFEGVFG